LKFDPPEREKREIGGPNPIGAKGEEPSNAVTHPKKEGVNFAFKGKLKKREPKFVPLNPT